MEKIATRTFSPYIFFGIILGLGVALSASLIQLAAMATPVNLNSLLKLHATMPLLWILDLLPLAFGLIGWQLQAGRSRSARLQTSLAALESELQLSKNQTAQILNNLPMTVLSINADRTIEPGYSPGLPALLGVERLDGTLFPDIFRPTDETIFQFNRWLGLVLGSFDVSWDSLQELAPLTEISFRRGEESFCLACSYVPLLQQGTPGRLLVVLSDTSHLKALEARIGQQQQRHEDDLSEIAEIIKLDYATFENFIFESKKLIFESIKLIESLEVNHPSSDKITDLFRKMHTLKSNSRAFNFIQLGQLAHTIEDTFCQLRDRKRELTDGLLQQLHDQIREVEEKLDSIIALAKNVTSGKDLGKVRSDNREVFIRVKLDKVVNLGHLIERLKKTEREDLQAMDGLIDTMAGVVDTLRQCPAMRLFSRFPKMVKDLSIAMGKNVNVSSMGGEIEMDLDVLDKLSNAVVHLVRNAVDHGIESPDERLDAGKPFVAKVEIKLCKQAGRFVFSISDDGRGIDTQAIVEKAIAAKLISAAQAPMLSQEQIHELILAPGLTTAQTITDISGRGIGMNVVAEILKALNGTITIKSIPGAGTTFILEIPDAKPENDFFSLDFAQDTAILTVFDASSAGSVNELRAVIYPIAKGEISRLYLNISRMHLVTSEFIGFLVTLNLLLKEGRKVLYIVNTNPEHNEALQLAHVNKMVEVISSM